MTKKLENDGKLDEKPKENLNTHTHTKGKDCFGNELLILRWRKTRKNKKIIYNFFFLKK